MGFNLRSCAGAAALIVFGLAMIHGHALPARAAGEQMIFVDPPMRSISQCTLAAVRQSILVCREPSGAPRVVRLSPNAVVWKGSDHRGTGALRPGDRLDIKLSADGDTRREVGTFVWANLVKREGAVGRWLPSEFQLEGTRIVLDGETQYLGPRRGSAAIVIGVQLDRNTVKATRVLFAER